MQHLTDLDLDFKPLCLHSCQNVLIVLPNRFGSSASCVFMDPDTQAHTHTHTAKLASFSPPSGQALKPSCSL